MMECLESVSGPLFDSIARTAQRMDDLEGMLGRHTESCVHRVVWQMFVFFNIGYVTSVVLNPRVWLG